MSLPRTSEFATTSTLGSCATERYYEKHKPTSCHRQRPAGTVIDAQTTTTSRKSKYVPHSHLPGTTSPEEREITGKGCGAHSSHSLVHERQTRSLSRGGHPALDVQASTQLPYMFYRTRAIRLALRAVSLLHDKGHRAFDSIAENRSLVTFLRTATKGTLQQWCVASLELVTPILQVKRMRGTLAPRPKLPAALARRPRLFRDAECHVRGGSLWNAGSTRDLGLLVIPVFYVAWLELPHVLGCGGQAPRNAGECDHICSLDLKRRLVGETLTSFRPPRRPLNELVLSPRLSFF